MATPRVAESSARAQRWDHLDVTTPPGFEPENEPNRFVDLQNSIERLRVPLGAIGIAWGHRKAVQMGPEWARGARAHLPGWQPDGVASMS